MMKKSISVLLLFCTFICLSCNKYLLNEKDKEEEKEDIFIEAFDGFTDVDLSQRSNWILAMNYSYIYDYTIDGKMIKSFPKDEPCYIPGLFIGTNNNGEDWLAPGAGPFILFASPSFYSNFIYGTSDTASIKIFDQTTEEKLLAADCLYCQYSGKASISISGTLVHYNALLDFELKNVPASATVMLDNQMSIKPFRDKKNPQHYKAIVFAYWGEKYSQVHITMNNKTYIVKLIPHINLPDENSYATPSIFRHIKSDTYYKFTLSFDKDKDTFTIGDIQNEVWSKVSIL
jgi:hypothetical protein